MPDPLEGVKLKIERANAHIPEVSNLIDAYLAPDPYETFTDIDPIQRQQCIKIRATQQPPLTIAVICGEILYGLRSALDHLVTAIATRRGITMSAHTGFPIERTRKEFETALRRRKIDKRLPALADALKRLEPYEGGAGDLLWWLHWLNGMEKHKILMAVAGANVGYSMKGELKVSSSDFDTTIEHQLGVPRRWQRLDKDATLFLHPVGTEFRGEMDLQMNVVFGDLEATKAYMVTDTLQQMVDATRAVVAAFEVRFFPSS